MPRHCYFVFLLFTVFGKAQTNDSIYHQLQEVEIKPFAKEAELRLLSSEGIILNADLQKQNSVSLLSSVNTIPGVRMEERSPGSYRLSIRGSLLRSPFGVRNIKIYLGDFPFSDAGGNTYLNALDVELINSLRILKGPEGSLFGANTGGVLLIDPVYKTPDTLKIIASATGGSYGLFHQNFIIQTKTKKASFNISQGYQRSDGSRINSAMTRAYFQGSGTWNYNTKTQLKFLALFSDLNYQTPGGLTLQQFDADPKAARPSTAVFPGAAEQKAGIHNRTLFTGISHRLDLNPKLSHVISISGSLTDFQNPFITNFEQRREYTFSGRSYIELKSDPSKNPFLKWNLGGEWQQTNSDIKNYGNTLGNKTTLQAADQINTQQAFLFTRFLIDVSDRFLTEVSVSYNVFHYNYKNDFPDSTNNFRRKNFKPQLLPRFAFSYKLNQNTAWRASISGGYSSPTIAEIRSSDNTINTDLQAEIAESYETGFRIRDKKDYFWLDVAAFYYKLKSAIVRRINSNGSESFINAGGTKQPGLEAQVSIWLIKPVTSGFIRALQLKANLTYNQFRFDNYKVAYDDFSNKKLTGVPDYTSCENLDISFPYGFNLYGQYYYSSEIPLNDGNTVLANAYHLVQLKASWEKRFTKLKLKIFSGIDNLLDQRYSLGNDLNAVGGRYYNAAAPRNYFAGLRLEF